MISHSIITRSSAGSSSLGHIDSYYKDAKDDYYSKENQPSQWQGQLAQELGLNGEVRKEQFIDLMAGKDPNNFKNQLRQDKFNNKDANTRLAIDLTFSAPKSVSIESLVHSNIGVMKAHELAVKKTLEIIETNAEARKKTKGITQIETTGKLAIGTFRHETNRNLDPHLHTHAVIINLTKREDGEYRALRNDSIIKNTKDYTKIYQTYLAKELKEMGFKLRITKDGFELAHISDNQIQAFSSRSQEVKEALEAKGLNRDNASTADKQSATLDTRQKKVEKDIVQVRHTWKKLANQVGVVSFNTEKKQSAGQERVKAKIGFNTFDNAFNTTQNVNLKIDENLLESELLNAKEKGNSGTGIEAGISGFSAGIGSGAGISGFSAGIGSEAGISGFSAGIGSGAGISGFSAGIGSGAGKEEANQQAINRTNERNAGESGSHAFDSNSRHRNGGGIPPQLWIGEEKNIGIQISYSTFKQPYSAGEENSSDYLRAMSGFDVATRSQSGDVLLPIDQKVQLQLTGANDLIGLRGSRDSLQRNSAGIDETLDDILDLDQADLSLKEQWKEKVKNLEQGKNDDELYFDNVENLKEFVVKHLTDKDHVIREKEIKSIIMSKGLGIIDYDQIDNIIDQMMDEKLILRTQARYENQGVLYSEYAVKDILGIYDDIDDKSFNKILKDNGFNEVEAVYTTQRAIDEDKEIIERLNSSQGSYTATYNRSEALNGLDKTTLNSEQKACALMVLSSDNPILGIQGYAGTGKSFMISRTKELIEDKGKEMVLFAPYSAQVKNLVDDGLEANTVAKLLVSKEIQDTLNENSVIVIDESGVINSKQMKDILEIREKIGCQIVLLGDTAQTKAVEAGTPFELLQKNGMETANMSDIQRQKNQVLRKAVVSSVQGDFSGAIDNLEHLSEIKDTGERHSTLVEKYLSLDDEERNKTLIVSGTNEDRQSINNLIREQTGTLGAGIQFNKLSQRKTTKAESDYSISYNEGDYVIFGKSNKRRKVESGIAYKVTEKDVKTNKITIEHEGNKLTVSPSGLQAGLFEESKIELSVGDKVRVTKSYDDFKTGDLLSIESVSKDTGIATAKDSDNKLIEIDLSKKHHLDYAYAMTVHASQGLTYDNVIVDLNTKSRTTSQETFYVGISRARNNAFVYTNSLDEMPESISRSATKHNAIELIDSFIDKTPSKMPEHNLNISDTVLSNKNIISEINVASINYIKVNDDNIKGDELIDSAINLADSKERIAELLVDHLDKYNLDGIHVNNGDNTLVLSKSSKEENKWQVTYFDSNMIPQSDYGTKDLNSCIKDLVQDINYEKLKTDMVQNEINLGENATDIAIVSNILMTPPHRGFRSETDPTVAYFDNGDKSEYFALKVDDGELYIGDEQLNYLSKYSLNEGIELYKGVTTGNEKSISDLKESIYLDQQHNSSLDFDEENQSTREQSDLLKPTEIAIEQTAKQKDSGMELE